MVIVSWTYSASSLMSVWPLKRKLAADAPAQPSAAEGVGLVRSKQPRSGVNKGNCAEFGAFGLVAMFG